MGSTYDQREELTLFDHSPIRRSTTRPAQIRASDAEREAVIDRLRLHAGDGRLDPDELEERIDDAYAARTRGQLAEVLRELPDVVRPPARSRGPVRRRHSPARRLVPMALVVVALAAAAGGPGEGWAERDGPPFRAVPAAIPNEVAVAAARAVPGGEAIEAEQDDGTWEVEVRRGGDEFEVLLGPDLDVLEVEED